jgi:hypothetical protein
MTTAPRSPEIERALWQPATVATAALRAAATVGAVLVFSLSPSAAVVLYVIEAWVYLSLRVSLEIALDAAAPGLRTAQLVRTWLTSVPAAALIFALMLGAYAFFICLVLYDSNNVFEFFEQLAAEPGFAPGIASVLAVGMVDAFAYLRRRRAGEAAPNKPHVLTLLRVGVLIVPAGILHELGVATDTASWIMLGFMAFVIVFYEGFPKVALRAHR